MAVTCRGSLSRLAARPRAVAAGGLFATDFAARFDLRSLAACLLPASGRADFVFRKVFAVPLCCPAGMRDRFP